MFFLKQLPSLEMIEGVTSELADVKPKRVLDRLTMLRHASVLLRELNAFFSSHGLSQTRFLILMVIEREPMRVGLQPIEIAERLDIAKPNVTVGVRALVEAKLLKRCPVSGDGRAVELRMTAKGKRTLKKLLPDYFALLTSSSS